MNLAEMATLLPSKGNSPIGVKMHSKDSIELSGVDCGWGRNDSAPGELVPECSRWKSGRREKASHHLHPESWAAIREDGGQALTGAQREKTEKCR